MIVNHGYKDLDFYIANEQGNDWYNPIKPYALLEYEWVGNNVEIQNKSVLDIGSHHGHYSLVFMYNKAKNLYLVEAVLDNLDISRLNLELNNFNNIPEYIHFKLENSKDLIRLYDRNPSDIIKMDIEGWEYKILPESLDKLDNVYCWILELHSDKKVSDDIIDIYRSLGYKIWWIDKNKMKVKEYNIDKWPYRTTMVAINEELS